MREILFRGKHLKTGEWWVGDLMHTGEKVSIRRPKPNDPINYEFYYVDPSTVGQFTGLTDKNGTKIFEGDIIKSTSDLVNLRGEKIGKTITKFYEVVVTNDGCSATYGTREIRETYISRTIYEKNAKDFYEVIGNIHDNLELLEVQR